MHEFIYKLNRCTKKKLYNYFPKLLNRTRKNIYFSAALNLLWQVNQAFSSGIRT